MPILYKQAKNIMTSMPDLSAPEDIEYSDGPDSFHILSVGESSIASIGVDSQAHGIAGFLAAHLKSRSQSNYSYEVIAKSGYTAEKVKDRLLSKISSSRADLIVIGLGANDAFKLSTPKKWHENVVYIISHLQEKFSAKVPIVFINMPPITDFPIFTTLLKFFVSNQLGILKSELVNIVSKRENVFFMDNNLNTQVFMKKYNLQDKVFDDFYSDGVHPSKITYSIWAKEIIEFLDKECIIKC